MSLTFEQIANEAVKLTPEAIAVSWDAEIERRMAQLDSGEVTTYSAEEVIAEVRAKLQ